jgi:hypothetical protein
MFSGMTKRSATIFVGAFQVMLKNLILNFLELTSLWQAIMQAVSYDNRRFEFHQDEQAASRW